MPRKPTPTTTAPLEPVVIAAGLAEVAAEHDITQRNVMALADQLGYDGTLTVGTLEDEIRFYQRRSVEAVLALGTRLLLLKEMTAQGEFVQRVELLGINKRMAQRFMSATMKFGKSDTKSLLSAAGSQTKLLELVILDDEEIAELANGGSAANLTLDDVARMTVTELRIALREARENEQATGRVIKQKEETINKLAVQLEKDAAKAKRQLETQTPDQIGADLRLEVAGIGYQIEGMISGGKGSLMDAFDALAAHAEANNCTHEEFMSGLLFGIERTLLAVRNKHNVKDVPDGDERPDWTRPDFDADAVVAAALAKEAGHA